MRRTHSFVRFALTALIIGLRTHTAGAQSGAFITGAGFADIKQFDSVVYDPRVLAAQSDPFSLSGTGAGGGGRIGTFLNPRWTLELSVDAGNTTKQIFPNPLAAIAQTFPTLRIPELSASTRFLTVSTVVGFHPNRIRRARLGYLAGFSFVRATHETEVPDYSLATATLTFTSGDLPFTTFLPPPNATVTTIKHIDNAPAAILGFEAAIDVSRKLALVPEVRALAFSTGGRGVFVIRPGVGARWNF